MNVVSFKVLLKSVTTRKRLSKVATPGNRCKLLLLNCSVVCKVVTSIIDTPLVSKGANRINKNEVNNLGSTTIQIGKRKRYTSHAASNRQGKSEEDSVDKNDDSDNSSNDDIDSNDINKNDETPRKDAVYPRTCRKCNQVNRSHQSYYKHKRQGRCERNIDKGIRRSNSIVDDCM